MAKLYLVDGSYHAFRVQFALPPMHSSSGHPTRVLYGFTTMLARLVRTLRPDYCAVAFDVGKTFRHERYPEYKGHRPDMPEDLRMQWPELPGLAEAFGLTALAVPGYEADDVLGTLAKRFAGPDLDVVLVTSDKDYGQLVGPHVQMFDPMKNQHIGPAEVQERWGVEPHRVPDALGLVGDSSDNIPGVPGVGPKRASQYLGKFGTLEGVLRAAADKKIKGKTGANLVEHAEVALLSRELATIVTDVPAAMELSLDGLAPRGLQTDDLRERFDAWDFGKVARKLLGDPPKVDTQSYRTVDTEAALVELVDTLRRQPRVALDTESTSLDPLQADLVGLSFAWSATDAVYVPIGHTEGQQVPRDRALELLAPLLEDPSVPKVGQNLKYDLAVLRRAGVELQGIVGDTMLLDYALLPHERRHGLDGLAQRHLAHEMVSYQEVSKREQLTFAEVSIDTATRYAAEDAQVTWMLDDKLTKRLDDGQRRIYEELELPLVPVLADMEARGIRLDVDALGIVRADLADRVDTLAARCHEIAGRPFNVNSRHELRDILFEELGYTPSKKVKDGWSTDSSVLDKLVGEHPDADLPATVLQYRHLSKLLGTYVEKLPEYVAEDGRIHSSFNQAVAATGRLSSADPNMQNIPIRTWEGQRIRSCFVPADGHVFLSCDYSQVELRILAHLCEEQALVEAFRAGVDIHTRTASEVLGVPLDQVGLEERTAAKAINYGLLYGMGAFRLAGDLGISRKQAQAHMDTYFARMPGVKAWTEQVKREVRETGSSTTLFGRRRLIPGIHSRRWAERAGAERLALNTPVQGTAADIMKRAMIDVHRRLRSEGLAARVLLQVHDELLLEVPRGEEAAAEALVVDAMRGAAELLVPLEVNAAFGEDWQQAHG